MPGESPPEPVKPRTKVRLTWPLALLLVFFLGAQIASALGYLGAQGQPRTGNATVGQLVVQVQTPARLRVSQRDQLVITVRNDAATPRAAIVDLDAKYLHAFGHTIVPGPEHAYHVVLGHLAPGETRRVVASLDPTQPGSARGEITVGDGVRVTRLPIRTFIFP
jgi:hypothetical protein